MNLLRVTFAVVSIAAASGCYAGVDEPVVYAEADTSVPPADVTVYPQSTYEGRTVYYYGDRWWYQDGHRWAYYRREPEQLHRHRTYVQTAPRAEHVYRAPPPQYGAPHVTSGTVEAPPATRVR